MRVRSSRSSEGYVPQPGSRCAARAGAGVSAAAEITRTNASTRTATPSEVSSRDSPNTTGPAAIVNTLAFVVIGSQAILGSSVPERLAASCWGTCRLGCLRMGGSSKARSWFHALLWPLLLVALLAAPVGASADQRFWVSPHGSDASPGTKAAPFTSLKRAQEAVRQSLRGRPKADVRVIMRGGLYRLKKPLRLTSRDSARHGREVVYRAHRGERPIISGAERVPGSAWSRYDQHANIWRARVGKVQTRELYVNGHRETRATTDDYPAGFRPSWNDGGSDSGIEYLPTIEPSGLNPASWGDPATWTNVSDIEAVILTQWKTMTVPLRSITLAESSTPGLLRMAN